MLVDYFLVFKGMEFTITWENSEVKLWKWTKFSSEKKMNLKNMCFPFGNRRMGGREEVELKSLSLPDSFLWNSSAARQRKRTMPAAMPRAKSLWEWVIELWEANQVSTSLIITHNICIYNRKGKPSQERTAQCGKWGKHRVKNLKKPLSLMVY